MSDVYCYELTDEISFAIEKPDYNNEHFPHQVFNIILSDLTCELRISISQLDNLSEIFFSMLEIKRRGLKGTGLNTSGATNPEPEKSAGSR